MTHEEVEERNEMILKLYDQGLSWQEITETLKISYGKVVQTIRDHREMVSFAQYKEGTKPAERFAEEWQAAVKLVVPHLREKGLA